MKADCWNAYIDAESELEPVSRGILDDLSFSVKDVFALKGRRNTAGNPDWLRTHEAASDTAPVIHMLLSAGAGMRGVTHTDELMYSLGGENIHYGTPVNPKAPAHVPGGSSSGSAVAVAAGLNDFAVGTDTGGSVRIPSSYCGIYGFRPTHGRISVKGVIPLAPSFDTVGWMAGQPELMTKIGMALGISQENLKQPFRQLLFASDAWDLLDGSGLRALQNLLPAAEQAADSARWLELADDGLTEWARIFRILQGIEIWEQHGEWITAHAPKFGPGIAERFAWTKTLSPEQAAKERAARSGIKGKMEQLLGRDGLLILPTAPAGAPYKGSTGVEAEAARSRVMQLSCIAGLSGFPQVTIPAAETEGLPLGLSVIAGPGQDGRLLKWVEERLVPLLPLSGGEPLPEREIK